MEDDLELRRYIRAVLRLGWLVVLLAVVVGAAGWGYAALGSTIYEATALLSVSRPLFALDLVSVAENVQVPVKTFGELAVSDGVLQTLHDRLVAAGVEAPEPKLLRRQLSASAATDTGLLRLNVADSSAADAAQIANLWAEVILEQSLALYGPDSPQMVSYTAQLDEARIKLANADTARANYQNQFQGGILTSQLGNLRAQYEAALDRQSRYLLLTDDVRGLLARLDAQDSGDPASTSDEAALLALVAIATNSGLPSVTTSNGTIKPDNGSQVDIIQEAPAPLQIQIGITGGVSSQTVGALSEAAQIFNDNLTDRIATANALVEALPPQILQLQRDLAEANRLTETYSSDVEQATNQYNALADQVSQAKIAAQDAAGLVRVASEASVPTESTSHRLTTAAVGALVGLILGVVIAVALEWWRTPLPAQRTAAADAQTVKTP